MRLTGENPTNRISRSAQTEQDFELCACNVIVIRITPDCQRHQQQPRLTKPSKLGANTFGVLVNCVCLLTVDAHNSEDFFQSGLLLMQLALFTM